MSDRVGTIRREEHNEGFSIWSKVAQAQVIMPGSRTIVAAEWLCVYSTIEANCGMRVHSNFVEHKGNPKVGVIPGTPAAGRGAA